MPYADPDVQRAYQRERKARRRAEWLADKACVICGSTYLLEIDHIDPTTKVSHRIWTWSQPRLEAELAKCQVLCRMHHQEKTIAARVRQHGRTLYAYGCRCEVCRAAKSASNARRRR